MTKTVAGHRGSVENITLARLNVKQMYTSVCRTREDLLIVRPGDESGTKYVISMTRRYSDDWVESFSRPDDNGPII
jgi:hypothetical protein